MSDEATCRRGGTSSCQALVWDIGVPAWRDLATVRQVVMAAGVVVGAGWLVSLVYLGADNDVDVRTFGWLTGGFVGGLVGIVALSCAVLAALGVQCTHHFELDKHGATTSMSAEQQTKGGLRSILLSLGRLFVGLGASQRWGGENQVLWSEVESFWVSSRRPVIKLKRGGRTVLVIRASRENQDAVCRYVRSRVRPPGSRGPGTRQRKALWEWFERS
ncbi:MAG: hypothetical protein N3B14_09745 [Thermoleophilia bacterium]|nr:hypothetical protein [Thermoleophilia bacterium]